jgi:hypothetical protein
MAKYYIKCGSLELIYSTSETPFEAACATLWECNDFDILDENFYVDERGFRDYASAQPDTVVIPLNEVADHEGWSVGSDSDEDCEGK